MAEIFIFVLGLGVGFTAAALLAAGQPDVSALVIAGALLCGVPVGVIIGLVLGSRMYRSTIRRKDDGDLDYSGGL